MTTVAILANPPRPDVVLPELQDSLLSAEEATDLYAAMLSDVATAVHASGGETLVNFRADDQLPTAPGATSGGSEASSGVTEPSSETELRSVVEEVLATHEDLRFEVQVGSSFQARVGNTVTHLLEREGVDTAAVVEPTAAFVTRQIIDSAAMKLRSSDVVLGPTTDGRVYYAGFGESIDFTDAFSTPTVETLTQRASETGLSVDFLPILPVVERPDDLLTAVPTLRSRDVAGRMLPVHTASVIEELGLRVVDGEAGIELTRQ